MLNPWKGKQTNNTTPVRIINNETVLRVQNAINNSDDLKKADDLKKMIDNPMMFEDGRKWDRDEKKQLQQAVSDYGEIQSRKKEINQDLYGIDSYFDEKSLQSIKLTKEKDEIESKLKEIDEHLSKYEELLNLLEKNSANKTPEEIEWESRAREQITRLITEKTNLNNSITEIKDLLHKLNNTEKNITRELESLLESKGEQIPKQPRGPQSAQAINIEMEEIKGNFCTSSSKIKDTFTMASNLFTNLFDCIKKISNCIAKQLQSCNDCLQESKSLLNDYPENSMQVRP